ncbi:MAG TPA: serpin family protein [Gemmatimonadaceae bacterium]|nr:serpin family protein [Gemmatimonadaceae bacterium]
MAPRCPSARRRAPTRLSAALLLATCAACSDGATAPKPITQLPRALTAAEQQVISGSNDFAFGLLREIDRRSSPDANIFISPLSASMALGMAVTGAAGSTLDSMRATLGFAGMSIDDIDASYKSLIGLLRGLDPRVDFRLANSIWYRQGFPVEHSFLDAGTNFFDAQIQALDFDNPSSVETINSWVTQSTNGKIDQIVDAIPRDMMLYLINAIYFKGTWSSQFDKAKTHPAPFHLADGSTQQVQMMTQEDTFPAVLTPEYSAAELPYGGGAYTMVVVVPQGSTTVDDLITTLDTPAWQSLLGGLTTRSGNVSIPRFELTWDDSLNAPLAALGMGIAFDAFRADFSGISKGGGLYISGVRQKTYVKVDEDGTVAAAATSVGMVPTSLPPALINADRPFLFAIRERLSGTILFVGKMMKPPEA